MKHKMVQNNLVKNSIAAYYAAVEIHNKPNITYRYETATMLMINAWELALKAFVRKYIKNRSIYVKGNSGETISFSYASKYVGDYLNTIEPKTYISIQENLRLILEYRNNIVHFYNEKIEPYIFMLLAKAALNYVDFMKKYFDKDVVADEGLFILPLGFKLPFRPMDFLSPKASQYVSSPESKKFINSILRVITDLNNEGIEDSVVIGFDVYLENVKREKNSDLIAAITAQDEANVKLAKVHHVNISGDPSAQEMNVSDEELTRIFPLKYSDVCEKCKNSIPGFKRGKLFNGIMAEIKKNPEYSYTRKLDPKSKKSAKTTFYRETVIKKIAEFYSGDNKA